MRNSVWFVFLCTVICFAGFRNFVRADSTHAVVKKLNAGLNFSVLNTSNWQGGDVNSFSFSADVDFNFVKTKAFVKHLYTLRGELGFTRYIDSAWQKQADQVSSQYILKAGKKKWSQTASSLLTAKVLNSYEYALNTSSGTTDRRKTGSFFSPSTWEFGYGYGYTFFQQSLVNLSLATARFRLLHESAGLLKDESASLAVFNNKVLYFDYGFSFHYHVEHAITRMVDFSSNGKVFLKAFNRDKIEVDLTGKWMFKLTRYLHLRSDIKLVYAPAVSYRLQFRNEFLIGFFYDTAQ